MADKKYALDFEMSDGTTYSVEFIVPQGEKGDEGSTPYIKDGYWWIENTSTGVKAKGDDGTSVYIDNITHSTESGGANVVEFSDGDTMTVLNGEQGIGIKSIETIGGDHNGSQHRITLDNGKTYDFYVEHGHTPDTSEIANAVLALLPVYDGEVESV